MPGKIAGLRNRNMARRIVLTNWELCSYIGTWSLYIAKHLNSLNVQQPRYASLTKGKQKAPRTGLSLIIKSTTLFHLLQR